MQPMTIRNRSAFRTAVSYIAAAGSVCFLINLMFNVNWRDLISLAPRPAKLPGYFSALW